MPFEHSPVTHEHCDNSCCPICEGGLFLCSVCGLLEGSLTTECPGYSCYSEKGDDVYQGKIDFVNGQWIAGTSKWSPAYMRNSRIMEVENANPRN